MNRLFTLASPNRQMCLSLGTIEVVSILVRKRNRGDLTTATLFQALADFRAEVVDNPDFMTISAVDAVVIAAFELVEKHAINGTDAIVLRSALDLAAALRRDGNDLILVAADQRLIRAAEAEGLATFNPEMNTQADLDALAITPSDRDRAHGEKGTPQG